MYVCKQVVLVGANVQSKSNRHHKIMHLLGKIEIQNQISILRSKKRTDRNQKDDGQKKPYITSGPTKDIVRKKGGAIMMGQEELTSFNDRNVGDDDENHRKNLL